MCRILLPQNMQFVHIYVILMQCLKHYCVHPLLHSYNPGKWSVFVLSRTRIYQRRRSHRIIGGT